jgi:hypothetical protein
VSGAEELPVAKASRYVFCLHVRSIKIFDLIIFDLIIFDYNKIRPFSILILFLVVKRKTYKSPILFLIRFTMPKTVKGTLYLELLTFQKMSSQ